MGSKPPHPVLKKNCDIPVHPHTKDFGVGMNPLLGRRGFLGCGGKPKIGIVSLGCPRNLVDSEHILGRLNLKGYSLVVLDKADIGIVNTCAFIEDSKKESVDVILDLIGLKKQGRLKKIIVYGCLSERYKKKLVKELPEIDAFVGSISFPAYHSNGIFHRASRAGSRLPFKIDGRENHSPHSVSLTPKHYAYLKICEGCVNLCSFCAIPKIKGRLASDDIESVLNKVRQFDRTGMSELNIIGQDITGYGIDLYGKTKLDELLAKIMAQIRHIGWVRLLYLYPSRLSDRLLEIIKNEPRLCKYIDLPIQHINNRILKLMKRNTTKKDIMGIINKIRRVIPQAALRTSVIVGMTSETDGEFKELCEFIQDVKFERLGAFIYSREEGTAAYDFAGQIPKRLKDARFDEIMSLQQVIAREVNAKCLGRTMDILIDEKDNPHTNCNIPPHQKFGCGGIAKAKYPIGVGVYLGRSQYDAPEVDGQVYVRADRQLKAGDFVKVKITDTLEYDLVGEALR